MTKIYFPEHQQILGHQSRVQVCPELFSQGFYWYGSKRHGPGRQPKRIQKKLAHLTSEFYRAPVNEASKDADDDDIIETSAGNGDQSAATSSDIEEHLQPSKGTGHRQTKQLSRNADISILTHHQYNLRSCNKKQTLSLVRIHKA